MRHATSHDATWYILRLSQWFCLVCLLAPAAQADDLQAVSQRLSADLSYLASDELAGRGVGSEGIQLAGEFIAERFQKLGLKVDAFQGTPFQSFSIPGTKSLGPKEQNVLSFSMRGNTLANINLGTDYTPLSLGKNGKFSGQVVFAGYGITATEYNYDDYAGIDAAGKVVIALRKEPQQDREDSRFAGKQNSQYAFFTVKELNASMHRAAALLLVNDSTTVAAGVVKLKEDLSRAEQSLADLKAQTRPQSDGDAKRYDARLRTLTEQVEYFQRRVAAGDGDTLVNINEAGNPVSDEQVPTYFCSRKLIDALLAGSGKTLAQLEAEIDADGLPKSLLLNDVIASGETSIQSVGTDVRNVIGLLPGAGALAQEYVVVGAHYDHVGMGGRGSLAPGTVAIHNGADDNGSGTVTMLEIARNMSEIQSENRRSLIFMAFTAEESGLLGSAHYVRNPRWPLERTVAMINLDMVGRLNNEELTVYGTGTAKEFSSQIDRLNERYKFQIFKVPQGKGPSDHASFYEFQIPVYHFFTGLHNDYHRPSDDTDKVNVSGMARISQMVTDVAREIAEAPQRPQLVLIQGSARPRNQSAARRARLGVQLEPDQAAPPRLLSIAPGGPAEKAGLKADDLLIAVNGTPVATVSELRAALEKMKVGDMVKLDVRRQSEQITLQATLGE